MLFGDETFSNPTQPKLRETNFVFGGETLNLESEAKLVFGWVTQKNDESSLLNVEDVFD